VRGGGVGLDGKGETMLILKAADWQTMGRKWFAEITAGWVGKVAVAPNAKVLDALADNDELRVLADCDRYTVYECGAGGPVMLVAACCNATTEFPDREDWEADGWTPETFAQHHHC